MALLKVTCHHAVSARPFMELTAWESCPFFGVPDVVSGVSEYAAGPYPQDFTETTVVVQRITGEKLRLREERKGST
jgi:hypothetical protein